MEQLNENVAVAQESNLEKLFTGKAVLKNGRFTVLKNKEEQKMMAKKLENSLAWKNYMDFKLGGVRTLKSILISAAVRLNPFNIPEVANLTSRDTLDLTSITEHKTVLYIMIPQTNKTYNFIASILYTQMFDTLYYYADTQCGGRLPNPLRIYWDEFVNTGKIPEFHSKISTCRKYNIGLMIFIQDIPQLKEMYRDYYETILSNCDSTIVLSTNDETSAKYISARLGKATITSRSFNRKKGNPMSSGVNLQQTGRELMMPDEITKMDNGKCIVMVRGLDPFLDDKYDLTQHPNYPECGDASPENQMDITKQEGLYNFADSTYADLEKKGEEPEEAKETVSPPGDLNKDSLGDGFDKMTLKEKFASIRDFERQDAVEYLVRAQKTLEREAQKAAGKKKPVLCMQVAVDDSLVTPYLELFCREYHKPVIIFNFTINGRTQAFFVDPAERIRNTMDMLEVPFHVLEEAGVDIEEYPVFATGELPLDKYDYIRLALEDGLPDMGIGSQMEERSRANPSE